MADLTNFGGTFSNAGIGIVLGDKVEDRVTGLQGIAVARVEYLNGCVQFCVQPRTAKDAMVIDSLYIDEGQLKVIGRGLNTTEKKRFIQRKINGGSVAHVPTGQRHP